MFAFTTARQVRPRESERAARCWKRFSLPWVAVPAALILLASAAWISSEGGLMSTRAEFTESTSNSGSSFTAASDFCSVTFDAKSSATGGSGAAWTHTVGAGGTNRLLVVGVSVFQDTVSSVTWKGTDLAFFDGVWDDKDSTRVELWYLANPATGSGTVDVNTNDDTVAGATSWTCVDQSTPIGDSSFVGGNSGTASTSVSSSSHSVVVDVVSADKESISFGAGQTERWDMARGDVTGGGSTEPGAASVTMSWSIGGGGTFWALGAVSLNKVP